MQHEKTLTLKPFLLLMRLDKPVGSFLLLWPTLWALWIASRGRPSLFILSIFILGVVIMRSAGCVINDFADRHVDGHVSRTKMRPLAKGDVQPYQALLLFSLLCLIGFILVLQLNTLTIKLSFIAVVITSIYPFTKRFTHFPQVVLGFAFAWGVPMAFAAQCNAVPKVGWLLYSVAALWPIAYDSMYALADKDDDVKIGIKSTVLFFGSWDLFFIFAIQLCVLLGLAITGILLSFKLVFYVGLGVSLVMMMYQYGLIKTRNPTQCLLAFKNNQWIGFCVFLGIFSNYLY